MKTFPKILSILLIINGSYHLYAQEQNFDAVVIKPYKLTEKIYMLEGMGGNIGVCAGSDGVLIIDDQFAPLTKKIKASIAEISDKPVSFIINTHFHFDHAGGNENFGREGGTIVAHANVRKRLEADQSMPEINAEQKATNKDGLPKITFGEIITMHYNDEKINLYHRGPAHTDGDVIIQFVNSNVIHGGDVFVRYGLPFIDVSSGGTVDGMISFLEFLSSLADEKTRIIPGHGMVATKKDVQEFTEMLRTIRDRVKALAEKGKTLEQIMAENPIKGYEDNGVGAEAFIKSVYAGVGGK